MDEQTLEDIQSDAARIISEKIRQINLMLKECEKLATETGIGFEFSPVYGMGGYFDPEQQEWLPSSQSC